jgi:cbb3-type cytochrome oxidase subunit 1
MLKENPDSAARGFLYSGVFWLIIGATTLFFVSAKAVAPGLLATKALSYDHLRAAASVAFIYGWLTQAALAALFYILPRVTGTPMRSERSGRFSGMLINLSVVIAFLTSFGRAAGHEYQELPSYVVVFLILALAIAAFNALDTLRSRAEPRIYASALYLVGGVILAPLSLALGGLTHLHGTSGLLAHLISINFYFLMWIAAAGIGAVYYVLPRASGNPLYSHGLAQLGFWSLLLMTPFAAAARGTLLPGHAWLTTLATSASIALLIPTAATVINVFGTLHGTWGKLPDHPSLKFAAGGSVFFAAAMIWGAVESFRIVTSVSATPDVVTGQIWMLLLGAATLWSASLVTYAFPRLAGRRWERRQLLTAHFWLTTLGVAAIGSAFLTTGIITGALVIAGRAIAGGAFKASIPGALLFRKIAMLGFLTFAIAQWIYALNVFRSTLHGQPRAVEVVIAEEEAA